MNIPLTRPCIGEEEKQAVCRVLDSGWLVQGPMSEEFEQAVCRYTGARFAVSCSSCTSALHLALLAAGIGPGCNVAVPAFTFTATVNAVEYAGARPVFVDVGPDLGIDVSRLEIMCAAIGISAVMPVHLFGQGADMDAVMGCAEEYEMAVIEDAACGLGAVYHGKHAGTMGIAGCYSFHPRKSITTGEGGVLVTDKADIADAVRCLRNQGSAAGAYRRHVDGDTLMLDYQVLGYNYRLTDIQAAIGVEQMKKLPAIVAARRTQAALYGSLLQDIPWLRLPVPASGWEHSYQSYVVMVPESIRNSLMKGLREKGIATRQGTHAVHCLPYYARKYLLKPKDFPNALAADRSSIALPVFMGLTDSEQQYIAASIKEIGGKCL
jgi:dTDP-4-amino-4,6-dideoxygalactose transaminase